MTLALNAARLSCQANFAVRNGLVTYTTAGTNEMRRIEIRIFAQRVFFVQSTQQRTNKEAHCKLVHSKV